MNEVYLVIVNLNMNLNPRPLLLVNQSEHRHRKAKSNFQFILFLVMLFMLFFMQLSKYLIFYLFLCGIWIWFSCIERHVPPNIMCVIYPLPCVFFHYFFSMLVSFLNIQFIWHLFGYKNIICFLRNYSLLHSILINFLTYFQSYIYLGQIPKCIWA